MSLLTGPQIVEEMNKGNIVINPFPKTINPNSVNLTLSNELLVYEKNYPIHLYQEDQYEKKGVAHWPIFDLTPLSMKKQEETVKLIIPVEGLVLWPGVLYLGSTEEYTETRGFAPCIEGRSSFARLGLVAHQSAGFGDNFFKGKWTLELTVIHPLRIFSGVEIVQIAYSTLNGEFTAYEGKYQGQHNTTPSRFWQEFVKEK